MHGAGNDFIIFGKTDLPTFPLTPSVISHLCDRRLGIGADGLIIIEPGQGTAKFQMHYFNSDGHEAEMCGNGARCSFAWAKESGLVGETGFFASAVGLHEGRLWDPGDVEVQLTGWADLNPSLDVAGVPWTNMGFCNTGVPHVVIILPDIKALADLDLDHWGPLLRGHQLFQPQGSNVNWAALAADSGRVHLRTFERGVEAETLACGTGAAAAAVILCKKGLIDSPVDILTRGGDLLKIRVDLPTGELFLRGPALESFRGEVLIDE